MRIKMEKRNIIKIIIIDNPNSYSNVLFFFKFINKLHALTLLFHKYTSSISVKPDIGKLLCLHLYRV